jgi:hypothetical protein
MWFIIVTPGVASLALVWACPGNSAEGLEEANVISAPGVLWLLQVRDQRCCLNHIVLDWKVDIVETGLNGTSGAVVVVNQGR